MFSLTRTVDAAYTAVCSDTDGISALAVARDGSASLDVYAPVDATHRSAFVAVGGERVALVGGGLRLRVWYAESGKELSA